MVQFSIVDEADIMIHNGTTWVGYQDSTSPYFAMRHRTTQQVIKLIHAGPIVSATEPVAATGQSDGTAIKDGDLWITLQILTSIQMIYRWSHAKATDIWVLLDSSDQTTSRRCTICRCTLVNSRCA